MELMNIPYKGEEEIKSVPKPIYSFSKKRDKHKIMKDISR